MAAQPPFLRLSVVLHLPGSARKLVCGPRRIRLSIQTPTPPAAAPSENENGSYWELIPVAAGEAKSIPLGALSP